MTLRGPLVLQVLAVASAIAVGIGAETGVDAAGPSRPVDALPLAAGPGQRALRPADWADLSGFSTGDHRETFVVLRAWCAARAAGAPVLRATAAAAAISMEPVCTAAAALAQSPDVPSVRAFFMAAFRPWRVEPPGGEGFLTGYYEPEVDGSSIRTDAFRSPLLSRPDDLVSFGPDEAFFPDERFGVDTPLAAARRRADGRLEPYPTRAAIEAGAVDAHTRPVVWLRDRVEAFLIHVQGSARVRLPDGTHVRLAYDGRNGQPYTSIGRILAKEMGLSPAELTLAPLKQWLRAHEAEGRAVMERNRSYIFFKRLPETGVGPMGAAGVPLTPLRSIAVDRQIWSYGLPFWIDAVLPWRSARPEPLRRLVIAQDTGSAIVGPARADIFFGSGAAAGERAGEIRHPGRFFVLLPKEFRP